MQSKRKAWAESVNEEELWSEHASAAEFAVKQRPKLRSETAALMTIAVSIGCEQERLLEAAFCVDRGSALPACSPFKWAARFTAVLPRRNPAH